jgi:hypothetical protein
MQSRGILPVHETNNCGQESKGPSGEDKWLILSAVCTVTWGRVALMYRSWASSTRANSTLISRVYNLRVKCEKESAYFRKLKAEHSRQLQTFLLVPSEWTLRTNALLDLGPIPSPIKELGFIILMSQANSGKPTCAFFQLHHQGWSQLEFPCGEHYNSRIRK